MIAVSNDFKKAMKQPVKEIDGYLLLEDGKQIKNDGDLISFKISVESSLCKTAMKKLEANLLGDYNLVGKWVKAFYGVKMNGEFVYIDAGSFFIKEQSKKEDKDTIHITGYDKMLNTMIYYTPLEVAYPAKLIAFAKAIAEKCNLELKNTTFTNENLTIDIDLYENINGITYRDILSEIAEATATICLISEDKLYFKKIYDAKETLTYDNLFTFKVNPKFGPVNSVILSREPQEDNIFLKDEESLKTNALCEVKIKNNQIVDRKRVEAITPLFNALKGLNYFPFEARTEGLGWYEIGDKLDVIHQNGDVIPVIIFEWSLSIDGGIKETFKAKIPDKTNTKYKYASSVEKRVNNTELIVDKQAGKINAIANSLGSYDEKNSSFTLDGDKISQNVDFHISFTRHVKDYQDVKLTSIHRDGIINLKLTGELDIILPHLTTYPGLNVYPINNKLKITNGTDTKYYELPYFWLNTVNGVKDEFIITKEKTTWIKRTDYFKNILPKEEVIEFTPIKIELLKGDNVLSIEGQNKVYIDCEYAINNELTDKFINEAQLQSAITVAKNEIDLSTSQKLKGLDGEELVSRINLTPKNVQISSKNLNINGITTINDKFIIRDDGSMEATDGLFRGILKTGINVLADSRGVFQTLTFYGDKSFSGVIGNTKIKDYRGRIEEDKSGQVIFVSIPNDFTIIKATLFVKCSRTVWQTDPNGSNLSVVPVVKNVKFKKVGDGLIKLPAYTSWEFATEQFNNLQDTKALGTNGITLDGNVGHNQAYNVDINVFEHGLNTFVLESDMIPPLSNGGGQDMTPFMTQILPSMIIMIEGYSK